MVLPRCQRTQFVRRLVVLVALAATVLASLPANAFEREGITIGRDQVVEKSYPGIKGAMPWLLTTQEPTWTPSICADANYCDVIAITLDLPASISDIWGINITVSWPNPLNREDYDVWLYDKDEVEVSSSYAAGGTKEDLKLIEPELRFFYLVVLHYEGTGVDNYKVKVEYAVTELEDYDPPPRRGGAGSDDDFAPPGQKPRPGQSQAFTPAAPEPEGDPRVKVPGADGDPAEFELPVVATKGQSARADEGSGVLWFVLGAVLLVTGAAGTALFLKRRSATQAL